MVKKVVRRAEVKGHRHGFRVSGVLLIGPLTIRDQYTNCATRLNIPNRTTTSNLPEHGQNPFQPCPSARRNRLSKNRKKNNSAAMFYPALECFCTLVSSSSSSSCFSQQKHRKPARYTALWPRNARNGPASPSTTTSTPPP